MSDGWLEQYFDFRHVYVARGQPQPASVLVSTHARLEIDFWIVPSCWRFAQYHLHDVGRRLIRNMICCGSSSILRVVGEFGLKGRIRQHTDERGLLALGDSIYIYIYIYISIVASPMAVQDGHIECLHEQLERFPT